MDSHKRKPWHSLRVVLRNYRRLTTPLGFRERPLVPLCQRGGARFELQARVPLAVGAADEVARNKQQHWQDQ